MAIGAALVPAESLASSAIGLACVPQSAKTAALCGELRDLIAASPAGHQVVIVDPEALPEYGRALRLTFVTLRVDRVGAQLDWREPGQDWQSGARQQFVVMDTVLTKANMTHFLQSLWTNSPANF